MSTNTRNILIGHLRGKTDTSLFPAYITLVVEADDLVKKEALTWLEQYGGKEAISSLSQAAARTAGPVKAQILETIEKLRQESSSDVSSPN
jgi:hypothetical protein